MSELPRQSYLAVSGEQIARLFAEVAPKGLPRIVNGNVVWTFAGGLALRQRPGALHMDLLLIEDLGNG